MPANPDILNWLQDNGFDIAQPLTINRDGKYALILAAQQTRCDVLIHLLQLGADTGVLDSYGNNALWAACFAEAGDCIAVL
jgi:thiosulfate/3-mercaptopyruvate sulfurtransferase